MAVMLTLLLLVPFLSGCAREAHHIGLADLFDVGFMGIGSHGSLSCTPQFPPGMDPEQAADVALRYLRSDPSALDWLGAPRRPLEPRGRDYWASAVAWIRGVNFDLRQSETDEDRDKRIRRLIEAIQAKERGELYYLDDYVESLDFEAASEVVRIVARFRNDAQRAAFVKLARRLLGQPAVALRVLGDDEDEEDYGSGFIRGRDEWAAVLAEVMGVPFDLKQSESREDRDQRIAALLKGLDRRKISDGKRGQAPFLIVYIRVG